MRNFQRPVLIFLLFCPVPLFAQQTLAVLDFDNNSLVERERLEPLRKGLAQMFTSELSRVQTLRLVERADLQRLLEEMKLAQAGLIDEGTAQQVGKLIGAQHLLLGSFIYLANKTLRIDVRLVQVETGRTLRAGAETGKESHLFEMIKRLDHKLVRELAIRLSAAETALLEETRNADFTAVLLYSQGVAFEDAKDFKAARKKYLEALQRDKDLAQAQQRLQALERAAR